MDKLPRSVGFGVESTPGVVGWDDPPTATPLADFRAVQRVLSAHTHLPAYLYMTPATYRAIRHAAQRGWWLALARQDKRWVRRNVPNWRG